MLRYQLLPVQCSMRTLILLQQEETIGLKPSNQYHHKLRPYRIFISYLHTVSPFRIFIAYPHTVSSYRILISYPHNVSSYRIFIPYPHYISTKNPQKEFPASEGGAADQQTKPEGAPRPCLQCICRQIEKQQPQHYKLGNN